MTEKQFTPELIRIGEQIRKFRKQKNTSRKTWQKLLTYLS